MINFNGELIENDALFSVNNRAFNYGDGLFETIKYSSNKLLFFEDHYFRLMSSMRIMRMEIPMTFTMPFFKSEIEKLLQSTNLEGYCVRVKILVFRKEGGLYEPTNNDVSFVITLKEIEHENYTLSTDEYVVDLYKDFYNSPSLLSSLKTNNKALNVVASVFSKENDFNNCLLLNTNKHVIEAINGNLFLVKGTTIKTPPISDGCLNGIMRKQLLELLKTTEYTVEESSISPFELQKADELFITNVITGIQPITRYRKKNYTTDVASVLVDKLNEKISSPLDLQGR